MSQRLYAWVLTLGVAGCAVDPGSAEYASAPDGIDQAEQASSVACQAFSSANTEFSPVQKAGSGLPAGADRIAWARPAARTYSAAFSGTPGQPAGHEGVDYVHNDSGVSEVPVKAAAAGVIAYVRKGCQQSNMFGHNTTARECGSGWGNHVVISHGKNVYTRYAHLLPGSIQWTVGDRVALGQQIGIMGNSGRSEVRHLHFELGTRAAAFNPCTASQSLDAVYDSEKLPYGNAPTRPLGEISCPPGYGLSHVSAAGGLLCINETSGDAWGPFTQGMVDRCKQYGGGPACDTNRWSKSMAVGLYGTEGCPVGSSFDDLVGYCAESRSNGNVDAFGPFPAWLVAKCNAAGGGATACSSARWNRNFLASLLP